MSASGVRRMGVIQAGWERYLETQLPVGLNEREALIASDAFLGGARAIFGILYAFTDAAENKVFFLRALEAVGRELGMDQGPRQHS